MSKGKQKECQQPAKLLTLDTETRGLKGEVFRVGLFDGETYHATNTFKEMLEIIKREYGDTQNHVYVHNLDFDLAKIARDFMTRDSVDLSQSIQINSSFVTLYSSYMILHDSFRLLPSALSKLSKDFGLEDDGKFDLTEHLKENGYAVYHEDGSYNARDSLGNYFMNVSPDEDVLNYYLELDCRSLHKILTIIMEIAHIDLEELVRCPTTASLAMKVYKSGHADDYEEATSTNYHGAFGRHLESFVRLAYYGGRTEVFTPELTDGYHYDVNSLYPYVMKSNRYPVGFALYLEDAKEASRKYAFWKRRRIGAGIAEATVIVPKDMHIPPLPYRAYTGKLSGKLLFPVGTLEGVWTFDELAFAEELGCEVTDIRQATYWRKTAAVFTEFVSYWEEIKNTSQGAKRVFAKLVQNSLYGKFGMARERASLADISKLDELMANHEPYDVYHNRELDIRFVSFITESKAQYIQPHLAVFVTSHARILLLKGLLAQQESGTVSYCDTDSIAGTSLMPEEDVHDKEYGKWKLEGEVIEGIFLQPKLYAERYKDGEVTIRGKGIPRDILNKLSYDDYKEWLEVIKDGKQERIEIFKDYEARKKFVTMLKKNEDFDTMQLLHKSINILAAQKRIMDYDNNTSHPHDIDQYEKELADEYERQIWMEFDDVDRIKEAVDEHGFIRIPKQGERFHHEYKQMSRSVRMKYFRRNASLDLDTFADIAGYVVNELVEDLRVM